MDDTAIVEGRQPPGDLDPDIGRQIEAGLALSDAEIAGARRASERIRDILSAFLDRYPVLLLPTTPCAAWPVDRIAPETIGGVPCSPRDHAAFTAQANHAGCPAISVPMGQTRDCKPQGLQILAAKGSDAALLALAQRIQPLLAETEPERVV